jgi:Uma2 family endonuclease
MFAPLELPLEEETHRVLWTREGVSLLVASGLLDGPKYELIEGEIVRKVKNRPHIIAVKRVLALLALVFDNENLQFESPIDVSEEDNRTSSPEPDIAVLNAPVESFLVENPGPRDIILLIEIADSTRSRDLGQKSRLYARAGILEYWVLDLTRRNLHLHRLPDGDEWRERRTLTENETVTGYEFAVSSLLPPTATD